MSKKEISIVEVKRSETGLGLFALRLIPVNTEIIEYKGKIVPIEEGLKKGGKYLFDLENGFGIDGSSRSNLARYVNHACLPNAEAILIGEKIWMWSKQDILMGEEITIDYGEEYFDAFIKPIGCKCKKCAP